MAYERKIKEQALAALAEGKNPEQIANRLGVTAATIRYWRKRDGHLLPPTSPTATLQNEVYESLVDAVKLGRLRLCHALAEEKAFSALFREVEENCSGKDRTELLAKLRILQPLSLREISDYVGSLLDRMEALGVRPIAGSGTDDAAPALRVEFLGDAARFAE